MSMLNLLNSTPEAQMEVRLHICQSEHQACSGAAQQIGATAVSLRGGPHTFEASWGTRTAMGPVRRMIPDADHPMVFSLVLDTLRARDGDVWLYVAEAQLVNGAILTEILARAQDPDDEPFKVVHEPKALCRPPEGNPFDAFLVPPKGDAAKLVYSYCLIHEDKHPGLEVGDGVRMRAESDDRSTTVNYTDDKGNVIGLFGILQGHLPEEVLSRIQEVSGEVRTFSWGADLSGKNVQTITFSIPEDVAFALRDARIPGNRSGRRHRMT